MTFPGYGPGLLGFSKWPFEELLELGNFLPFMAHETCSICIKKPKKLEEKKTCAVIIKHYLATESHVIHDFQSRDS
jgi:hypothetical protein